MIYIYACVHTFLHIYYISIYIYIRVHKLINFIVAVHNGSKEYSNVAIGEILGNIKRKKKEKLIY